MKEFYVELLITNGEKQNIRLSDLNEKELEEWGLNLEERALEEYHNREIKIIHKNPSLLSKKAAAGK